MIVYNRLVAVKRQRRPYLVERTMTHGDIVITTRPNYHRMNARLRYGRQYHAPVWRFPNEYGA